MGVDAPKVVVVTGAGRGIGRAISEAFAAYGAHVVLAARSSTEIEAVGAAIGIRGGLATIVACDVTDETAVEQLIDRAANISGVIDVVVANAGSARVQPFHEQSLADWQLTLAATLTGTFLLLKHAVVHMREGGQIFTIGSVASRTAFPGWAAYSAAKFGLLGFTNAIREELRPSGIRVTSVLAGAVDTQLWHDVPGEWNHASMLQPTDVARAVLNVAAEPPHITVDEIIIGHRGGVL